MKGPWLKSAVKSTGHGNPDPHSHEEDAPKGSGTAKPGGFVPPGAKAGSAQAKIDFETETESTTPSGATKAYKAAYDAMSIKLTGNEQD